MTQDLIHPPCDKTEIYVTRKKLPSSLSSVVCVRVSIPPHTEKHMYFHVLLERALLQRAFPYLREHSPSSSSSSKMVTIVCAHSEHWFSNFLRRLSSGLYRDIGTSRTSILTTHSITFESGLGIAVASPDSTLYAGIVICVIRSEQELTLFSSFFERHRERLPLLIYHPDTLILPTFSFPTMGLMISEGTFPMPAAASNDIDLSSFLQSISLD